ncbi:hypothetical protein SeMB42_g02982 [Synchytrium endobioticum]|uniref:Uncharacterized protein n=1 Tax=Synchytrium endobioticum TaxID=286115 RepID=A0A507DAT8_9FUNG|nr:hypothetical protein SeMB42_g02984 [Synchytrium endobioticum]TPX48493.1 hypothetical protein SeMB42_g02982 [Synchytrium endobioticum]
MYEKCKIHSNSEILDQVSMLGRWWLDVPGPFASAIHREVWWSSSKGGLTNRKTMAVEIGDLETRAYSHVLVAWDRDLLIETIVY